MSDQVRINLNLSWLTSRLQRSREAIRGMIEVGMSLIHKVLPAEVLTSRDEISRGQLQQNALSKQVRIPLQTKPGRTQPV